MPREKGFVHCLRKMGPQTAVYDLTLGFPSIRDHNNRPTLKNLANGKLPEMEVHVRRYAPEDVPHGADDATIGNWYAARIAVSGCSTTALTASGCWQAARSLP